MKVSLEKLANVKRYNFIPERLQIEETVDPAWVTFLLLNRKDKDLDDISRNITVDKVTYDVREDSYYEEDSDIYHCKVKTEDVEEILDGDYTQQLAQRKMNKYLSSIIVNIKYNDESGTKIIGTNLLKVYKYLSFMSEKFVGTKPSEQINLDLDGEFVHDIVIKEKKNLMKFPRLVLEEIKEKNIYKEPSVDLLLQEHANRINHVNEKKKNLKKKTLAFNISRFYYCFPLLMLGITSLSILNNLMTKGEYIIQSLSVLFICGISFYGLLAYIKIYKESIIYGKEVRFTFTLKELVKKMKDKSKTKKRCAENTN
jgi:hypothetical protein